MVISSRTPEGDWNRCPVCDQLVRLEPSSASFDGTCPSCGQLLWFAPRTEPTPERAACLLYILELRFGPLSTEMREAIEDIAERGNPDVLVNLAVTASTLQAFLDGPADEVSD